MDVATVDEKRRWRLDVIRWLYEQTGGDSSADTEEGQLHRRFDELPAEERNKVLDYLYKERLLTYPIMGKIALTHRGVQEYEEGLSKPDLGTQHLAPVNLIIGDVSQSQIQQGTIGSRQEYQFINSEIKTDLQNILQQIKLHLADLNLDSYSFADAVADIAGLEAQLATPQPRSGIVRELLKSLRTVLEGAASGALAQQFLTMLPHP